MNEDKKIKYNDNTKCFVAREIVEEIEGFDDLGIADPFFKEFINNNFFNANMKKAIRRKIQWYKADDIISIGSIKHPNDIVEVRWEIPKIEKKF